jgi:hypothetical protein
MNRCQVVCEKVNYRDDIVRISEICLSFDPFLLYTVVAIVIIEISDDPCGVGVQVTFFAGRRIMPFGSRSCQIWIPKVGEVRWPYMEYEAEKNFSNNPVSICVKIIEIFSFVPTIDWQRVL